MSGKVVGVTLGAGAAGAAVDRGVTMTTHTYDS